MMDRAKLTTEKRNPASRRLDTLTAQGVVDAIAAQDALVAPAVRRRRVQMARAVELVVRSFNRGGRLVYVGAGTSGRLGVLDASECPPTYGVARTLVQGIIAGGRRALTRSIEGAEDDARAGELAVNRRRVSAADTVVGIAACGLTPFVRGALLAARRLGAATVMVTCAPQARGRIPADVVINPVVGPEIVAGSTRMKAGTATKLVLNTLTTSAMVLTGKVYDGLMVDLRATNAKLRDRARRIVMQAAKVDRRRAAALLAGAGGSAKLAILMALAKCGAATGKAALAGCGGSLRKALACKGAGL
jgi:N-acetylmuramic acid 6-phosphate etherase